DRGRNREQADCRHAGHGARDLGVARPALPRRAGTGPDLHAARQSDRHGRGAAAPAGAAAAEDALMSDAAAELAARRAAGLAIDPAAPALECGGRWRRWGELGATLESVAAQLPVAGTRIGVLLRNRPAHVALVLGALRAGACVVAIDPQRGADRVRG